MLARFVVPMAVLAQDLTSLTFGHFSVTLHLSQTLVQSSSMVERLAYYDLTPFAVSTAKTSNVVISHFEDFALAALAFAKKLLVKIRVGTSRSSNPLYPLSHKEMTFQTRYLASRPTPRSRRRCGSSS